MLENQTTNRTALGYIRLDHQLTILESSGKLDIIFTKGSFVDKSSFLDTIFNFSETAKKSLMLCLEKTLKQQSAQSCLIINKEISFQIICTPLSNNEVLLHFLIPENKKDDILDKTISENSPQIVLAFNMNLQHTYVSDTISQLANTNSQAILGKKPSEAKYMGDYSHEFEKLVLTVFQHGESQINDFQLVKRGKKIWFNAHFTPVLDTNGNVTSVIVYMAEITNILKKQQALHDDNERLQLAIEASDNGIWDWEVGSEDVYYSRKWKSQLGYYHDELTDKFATWESLLHPEDKDRMLYEVQNFLKSESYVFEAEFRLRHKNGNYIWIKNRASCIRDENNHAVRLLGVNRDITSEKKSDESIQLFRQLALQSPTSIIMTDLDGYIEFFNPAFCRMTGWEANELKGKRHSILKSDFHTRDFYYRICKTITEGNVWQGELKNKKKNGRYYWEQATISPIKNQNGIITHFMKVSDDISILKKYENDLREARHSVVVANVYKNNFLANMSHKIRTPINGIIGFSDLLKNGDPSEMQKLQYINIIVQNSNMLLHLIDNIIDVARIEASEMKIKKESCSLRDLFIELKPQSLKLASLNGKENITIKFVVPKEEHHDVIFTDPVRLKQILSILFENSLKQTEQGFIEVGYQIYSDRKLQFYVEDTGMGMGDEQANVLTQQFRTNERNIGHIKGGMGLGLAICRGLIRLLGGQVGLKTKKGKGTIFYFTIPYDKIKVQTRKSIIEETKTSKYDFSKYTILIAEDVSYNFEYLKTIFDSTGAKIIWAKDGIDVLNVFANQHVDLILMDIQMPEISGFEATIQIRKKNTKIPIIAQTGFTTGDDRDKCIASGCNDVLIKPLKIDDVLRMVAKYLPA